MKSRIEEAAHRWVAELVQVTQGEDVVAVETRGHEMIVLTENRRVYRVTAVVSICEDKS